MAENRDYLRHDPSLYDVAGNERADLLAVIERVDDEQRTWRATLAAAKTLLKRVRV